MLPLDEAYFDWLYDQVSSGVDAHPAKSYVKLLQQLFFKEFVWIIGNDDNRAEDGRILRDEFMRDCSVTNVDEIWLSLGCSMLELLIGLSRRLSYETEWEPLDWFWVLIKNLHFDRYTDNRVLPKETIDEVLDDLIWRTYEPDGTGGLFPLKHASEDQRDVELWYQLNAYLLENIA